MIEHACMVDDDIQAIIRAFSLLRQEEREQILHLARHPEELRNMASFEEIQITCPPDQAP